MTLINNLNPEIIQICRPLIFNDQQLQLLVKKFTERWEAILASRRTPTEVEEAIPSAPATIVAESCCESLGMTDNFETDAVVNSAFLRFESPKISYGKAKGGARFSDPKRRSMESEQTASVNPSPHDSVDYPPSTIKKSAPASSMVSEEPTDVASIAKQEVSREPLFTIINITTFPTGKEEGKFLGLGVNQDIIDIALVTTYGGGDYSSVTASYPSTNWRFLPLNVAQALAEFVKDKNLMETNIVLTLAAYTTGMPTFFLAELKEKMAKFPELNNVFVTDTVLSNTCGLVFAGKFETSTTKFAITLGEKLEVYLIKKIFNEKGKKKRSVLAVDGSQIFHDSTMGSIRTEIDDPKLSLEDLVSADGLPRLLQVYLIEAIKKAKLLRGIIPERLKDKGAIKFEDVLWLGRPSGDETGDENPLQQTVSFLQRLGFKRVKEEDCIQVEFIARTIARRSCYVIGACAVALALLFKTKSVKFVTSGSLLYFPNYGYYFRKVVDSLIPEGREVTMEDMGRNGACRGAALFAASEAKALIKKLDGKRRLPPFQLKKCCLDSCKIKCGCKTKWA